MKANLNDKTDYKTILNELVAKLCNAVADAKKQAKAVANAGAGVTTAKADVILCKAKANDSAAMWFNTAEISQKTGIPLRSVQKMVKDGFFKEVKKTALGYFIHISKCDLKKIADDYRSGKNSKNGKCCDAGDAGKSDALWLNTAEVAKKTGIPLRSVQKMAKNGCFREVKKTASGYFIRIGAGELEKVSADYLAKKTNGK